MRISRIRRFISKATVSTGITAHALTHVLGSNDELDLKDMRLTKTSGSILFSDGSKITEDNANLFWDNVNKRLGIGTKTPAFKLDVAGSIKISSGSAPFLKFPDPVVDNIIEIYGTNHYTIGIRPYTFLAKSDQRFRFESLLVNATYNVFEVGSPTATFLVLSSFGNLGIGTTSPAQKLHVVGNIRADGDVIPDADNLRNIGSDTLRWALVRAVNVVTGSLNLKSEKGDWTLEEGEDGIYAYNNKTGKKYKVRLDEVN